MTFTQEQLNRVGGVLSGMAAGDALGAGYEFNPPMPAHVAVSMIGGGLGDFAPGEWTDDTSMAVVIARALLNTGGELTEQASDQMVREWAAWAQTAPDVGNQTRSVFNEAQRLSLLAGHETLSAADAIRAAETVHQQTGRSGGNGSLMRTAPIALAFLNATPQAAFEAAVQVSRLTHFDPEAGEACGLWTVAIRHAILTGELNVSIGLPLLAADRATIWESYIAKAQAGEPRDFTRNGWVIEAFQGAWSAILNSAKTAAPGQEHLVAALEAAVRGGVDTDTVAAIAGSLIGAAYGLSAIPQSWLDLVHGWPGLHAKDLLELSEALVCP